MPRDVGPLPTPFTVYIDDREKRPFAFANLRTDARDGNRPLQVRTQVHHLGEGDYAIRELPGIALERKGIGDLFSTIGQHRERFERELARLDTYYFAAVVVEAGWDEILARPPAHSKLPPKIVYRSVLAWVQRFPRVHWFLMPNRRLAEVTTYRLLERYWRDRSDHAQGRPTEGL